MMRITQKLILIAVLLPGTLAIAGNRPLHLTVLYTNDIHAQVLPMKAAWLPGQPERGGFATLSALVRKIRQSEDNVLFLSAGDVMTGPPISRLTRGEAVFDLLNRMGYDAMCLGNHEFDHGWENTRDRMFQADFPVLAANIFYRHTEIPFALPCILLKRGPLHIGIIGVLGRTAALETINGRLVTGLDFRDQVRTLNQWVPRIRPYVDILILLAHEGKAGMQSSRAEGDPQRDLATDIRVASSVPGIDLLITGHAHRGVERPIIVPDTGTRIVSTYGLGTRLGRVDIQVDPDTRRITTMTGTLIPVDPRQTAPDPEIRNRIAFWEKKLRDITGEIIGHADTDLTRIYYGESTLGNLTADAFREAAGTPIALTNPGGLRADIPAGDITTGQVLAAYPFENPLVRLTVTGSQLLEALEHGASLAYGMCQVSGMTLTVNLSRPVGHRVTSVRIQGKPLDPDRNYVIATSDYLATGGDGYRVFLNGKNLEPVGIFCTESIIRFIRNRGTIRPDGRKRIRIIHAPVRSDRK